MLYVAININLVDSVDGEELVDAVNSGYFESAVSKVKLVDFVCQRVGRFCRRHQLVVVVDLANIELVDAVSNDELVVVVGDDDCLWRRVGSCCQQRRVGG